MTTFLMYAGIFAASVWGYRILMRKLAAARALNAVGKNVALVAPRVQPDGMVELNFIVGEFQLIDANFYLRLPSDEAFIVPGPLLIKLKGNPAPELFDGAPYLLRLSDDEARQLQVRDESQRDSSAALN